MKIYYMRACLLIAGLAVIALVAGIVYAATLFEVKTISVPDVQTASVGHTAETIPGGDLEAAASTRPALTRPDMMGGPCCKMK